MKSNCFFGWLLLGGMLLLASCRPELSFVDGSFISSQASVSGGGETITVLFGTAAGRATIDLSASGDWKAEFVNGRAYWCSLSATEGGRGIATLTISVEPNGEYDERSASIVFTCKDLKRTIVVAQKQRDALLLSSDRVEMDADGGSFTVDVMTNVDFSHEVETDGGSWLRSVGTKGLEKSTLVFQVDPNGGLERRSGQITFTTSFGTETVKVYQKGEVPTLVLSEEAVGLPAEEGMLKVDVASNIDVSLEVPEDCTWLREVTTKTISTRTFTFAYERNHGREARICNLVFRNDSHAKAETVSVSQQPADILLDGSEYYLPSQGDELAVRTVAQITSFSQFRYDSGWLEPLRADSDDTGVTFRFRIGKNPQRDVRAVSVAVYRPGFDHPEIMHVTQFGQYPSFSYTVSGQELAAPEITESGSPFLVIWGDGSYERYAEGLRHRYSDAGSHTVRIEGRAFPLVLFPAPQDGMTFDFSTMKLQ